MGAIGGGGHQECHSVIALCFRPISETYRNNKRAKMQQHLCFLPSIVALLLFDAAFRER
jgi:hypothetical protein